MLTPAQLQTLKTAIQANSTLNDLYTLGDLSGLAAALNAPASPDYWIWRKDVSRADLYHGTSPTGSTFNWTTYKGQTVPEQNAWVQMFMGDMADFSLLSLRSGVKAIFTGSAAQNTQRDHCFAIARRKATVMEKVFAVAVTAPPVDTGNDTGQARGSAANPDVPTVVGEIFVNELIGL